MKTTAILAGSVIAGNLIAERFFLKSGKDDPTGFVEVNDGFGMDDVVRAATIIGISWLLHKFI